MCTLHHSTDSHIGWSHLKDSVTEFEKSGNGKLTALCPPMEGIDPDDAFSSVPYEKGFNLLYDLQTRVGEQNFKAFARVR